MPKTTLDCTFQLYAPLGMVLIAFLVCASHLAPINNIDQLGLAKMEFLQWVITQALYWGI